MGRGQGTLDFAEAPGTTAGAHLSVTYDPTQGYVFHDQTQHLAPAAADNTGCGALDAHTIQCSDIGFNNDETGQYYVTKLYFSMGPGDDFVTINVPAQGAGGPVSASVGAGTGNNNLFGGDESDSFTGGAGNDIMSGGNGNDTMIGGGGADQLHGGNGNDILEGNSGNDTLYGDDGNDTLIGGAAKTSCMAARATTGSAATTGTRLRLLWPGERHGPHL